MSENNTQTPAQEKPRRSREDILEIIIAIFLGVTALATAWASWIGSLHGGNMSTNYTKSNNPPMDPIGWIDTDLSYHEITADMLADENYKIKGVSLKSQRKNPKDNVPSKAPITWLMSGRLTKELGNIGGISFYANNILFYEPFLKNSTSNTLVQRNTGSFSFGVELFFNL